MSDELCDLEAERNVLGALLMAPDVFIDVASTLRPDDFYRPAHETIWQAIAAQAASDEPVDPVLIMERLRAQGDLNRVGGPEYLHTLVSETASAANALYYARIVHRYGGVRRVQSAAMQIEQLARSSTGGDLDDLRQRASSAMDRAVDDQKPRGGWVYDTFPATLESLSEPARSIPSPWSELDRYIGGFSPGRLVVVGARPGVGKALALDTPIPTPDGWTTMGEIKVGDEVLGVDGLPAKVSRTTPVQHNRICYEVEFSDGEVITADADHLWFTETRASRRAAIPPARYTYNRTSPFSRDQRWKSEKPSIKTTREISETLRVGPDDRLNHSIPLAEPLDLPDVDLPVDPYVLGYWLGDGTSRSAMISVGDDDLDHLLRQVERAGYHHRAKRQRTAWAVRVSTQTIFSSGGRRGRDSLQARLHALGVIGRKHVPAGYLRSGTKQRQALLAGLLDSDGTVSATSGRVTFTSTSATLAADVTELIRTLGYQPSVGEKRVNGRTASSSTAFNVGFVANDNPFRLPRKADRVPGERSNRASRRYICDVRQTDSVPVRCIQVENIDHMYLAGRAMVPTHNTAWALQSAMHTANQPGFSAAYASLEMTEEELHFRMLSQLGRVPYDRLERRGLGDRDWDQISGVTARMSAMRVNIMDTGSVRVHDVWHYVRGLNRRQRIGVVVVDYLQLMQSPNTKQPRHEVVADYSRQLKLMAKDQQVCVIACSQLNRASTSRRDGRPGLSDLRETGAIEQDADAVVLLHRDVDGERQTDMEFIIGKNRHGSTGIVKAEFIGRFQHIKQAEWSPHDTLD